VGSGEAEVITFRYNWKEPPDLPDALDRMMRPAETWPAPKDDKRGHYGRGRPFTADELDAYFRRGGRITYRHRDQDRRDRLAAAEAARIDARAGLTKLQYRWVEGFNSDCAVDADQRIKKLLPHIRSVDRRGYNKWIRIRDAVKAIGLGGWCQADYAAESGLEPAYLSKILAEAYNRFPSLEHPLRLANLLNLLWKRRQLTSRGLLPLQGGGGERSDDDPQKTADRLRAIRRVEQQYNQFPWGVKLAELHYRAFPTLQSNWCAMVDVLCDETPSGGTQRVERVIRDSWGHEIDRTDYRARLSPTDHDQWFDAVDAWQRLRQFVGLSNGGPITDQHVILLLLAAEAFFTAEHWLRGVIDSLPTRSMRERKRQPRCATPWSLSWPSPFVGAPSSHHGYLGPIGHKLPRCRCGAPYVERVNECPEGRKKLRPKNPLRRTTKLEQRWAAAVHDHSPHVLNNVNNYLRKLFPEPPPQDMGVFGWKAFEARMREAKWSKGPMCTPRLRTPAQHCAAQPMRIAPRDRGLFVPDFNRGQVQRPAEPKTHVPMVPQTMVEVDQHQTVNRDAFMKLGLGTPKIEAYQRFICSVSYDGTDAQPTNLS
jgi:hypothetical protein